MVKYPLQSFPILIIVNHMVNYSKSLSLVFSALADPIRRQILERLYQKGDSQVTDLAEPFPVSLPAISRHLRVLEKAGLIKRERDGRIHNIHAQPEGLKEAQQWIDQFIQFWEDSFDALDELLKKEKEKEE